MKFEFHGVSAAEENDRKDVKSKESLRFLPSKAPRRHSRKKQRRKHSKHEKELRGTVKKLTSAVNAMQAEIDLLKNYDKDGFYTLRRKKVEW